jgi:dTDP-4-dehydrorhamnose 3,5-epimerase
MRLTFERTDIPDLVVIEHEIFRDDRGFFLEVFRRDAFRAAGLPVEFVQFNHSGSARNVLRGLHMQWDPPMGKLMRVVKGRAYLVAVDIRLGSPTLGEWFGIELCESDSRQVWAPAGFARGFCSLEDDTQIQYLCTGTYNSNGDGAILWNDPALAIEWPIAEPVLSAKDSQALGFDDWLNTAGAQALRWEQQQIELAFR